MASGKSYICGSGGIAVDLQHGHSCPSSLDLGCRLIFTWRDCQLRRDQPLVSFHKCPVQKDYSYWRRVIFQFCLEHSSKIGFQFFIPIFILVTFHKYTFLEEPIMASGCQRPWWRRREICINRSKISSHSSHEVENCLTLGWKTTILVKRRCPSNQSLDVSVGNQY